MAGGQTIPLEMSSEIKDNSGLWAATDTMQTPMGAVTDTTMIEKHTLIPRERHLKQGQVAIDVTYAAGKATGTMNMNGQKKPIQVDLGGPLFADSAGSMQSIAALPLADGYRTTFRNFDLQSQKPKLMQLTVADSENVTVPAGTFQAYKIDISSTDSAEKMTHVGRKGVEKDREVSGAAAADGECDANGRVDAVVTEHCRSSARQTTKGDRPRHKCGEEYFLGRPSLKPAVRGL